MKNSKRNALSVLPLCTTLIYPQCIGTVQISRRRSLNLIHENREKSKEIALVLLKDTDPNKESSIENFYHFGVTAKIIKEKEISPDIITVTMEGIKRIKLDKFLMEEPYFVAYYDEIDESKTTTKIPRQVMADITILLKKLIQIDHSYSVELINIVEKTLDDPGFFADCVASNLHLPLTLKQRVLESINFAERLAVVKQSIEDEVKKFEIQTELDQKVNLSIQKTKRESILREQLRQIHKELGEEDPNERLIKKFKHLLETSLHIPQAARERIRVEIERLNLLSIASAEYGSTKNYIELLLDLPWNKTTDDESDIAQIEKIINAEYYGPRRVKDRIMEYLVVRKLTAEIRSPILCLSGPPGTGKSSLAAAIARGLGRKLITINAAGISIPEEINGDIRNFLGAMPGKIMRALAEAKTSNPVMLVDDLDKMAMYSENMSLSLTMLDVLDPKRNKAFIDTYVGIPFNLSGAIFIIAVESLDDIPQPLTERMEIIEFSGYIESEKIEIGQKFIIPKLCQAHNLTNQQLRFSAEALRRIIRNYTLESGLIGFKREIELICRKVSRQIATQKLKTGIRITEKNLESYLGPQVFIPERVEIKPEIGVANGLAWTGAGGDIMMIEGIKMRGGGNVIYTGSLGEVMKESIQASHSYVRAKAEMLGIDYDDFINYDIHIHFPSGGIPKDGPSAGVTISTVIASLMSDRPISNDIALTGEVSLRGKVLAVSGIKEKVAAAHRAGIFKVILPRDNEKDIHEMPQQIIEDMEFIFVERLDDVFEHALLDYEPEDISLETLLKKEIQKVKEQDKKERRTALHARKKKKSTRGRAKK